MMMVLTVAALMQQHVLKCRELGRVFKNIQTGFIGQSVQPSKYYHKMAMAFSWTPLTIHQSPFAVVLLNQPIRLTNFVKFWNSAKVAVSVDGASNYLYDLHTAAASGNQQIQNPHFISGDFDSINQDTVLKFYKDQNVQIVHTPDQDNTDFTKALLELEKGIRNDELSKVDRVLAIVETNGRLDHIFANIKTLFTPELTLPVFILSQESLTWLLQPGKHTIHVDQPYIAEKYPCGVIPICGPTHMVSTGLQWNLNDIYKFDAGGIISTSNRITEEVVEITTEKPTVWTMQTPRYNFE